MTLVDQVFHETRQVHLNGEPTVTVTVDRTRFDRVMASSFRALIYHECGEKLSNDVTVFSLGIRHKTFERDADEATLAFTIRTILQDQPRLGKNPEVFWYQFFHRSHEISAMRFEFHQGFTVYAVADTRSTGRLTSA